MRGLSVVSNFITPEEEKDLLKCIYSNDWSGALKRRVQHYGWTYDYKKRNLDQAEPLPEYASFILSRLCEENVLREYTPEQLIINEYTPGQGISKHIDSDIFGEIIISLSLGSGCSMIFKNKHECEELYLKPCSLLILSKEARNEWTHEIPSRKSDVVMGTRIKRDTRVSMTFRTLN